MIVDRCATKSIPAYNLPWGDVKEEEGVYDIEGIDSVLIVLASTFNAEPYVVFCYDPRVNVLQGCKEVWAHKWFRKSNKTICFELKDN